jgi:hypothetical protein
MSLIRWIGVALGALALASGCMYSRVDENWGSSYDAQIVWQMMNPEAPATTEPLEGLDPETGMLVAERYYKSQEQQGQRQAPTVVIGELK